MADGRRGREGVLGIGASCGPLMGGVVNVIPQNKDN